MKGAAPPAEVWPANPVTNHCRKAQPIARTALQSTSRNELMKWYYQVLGGHTHVRVFMNGGKCGDLCFRNEEFQLVRETAEQFVISSRPWITFIEEKVDRGDSVIWHHD